METRSNHILVGSVVLAMILAVLGFIVWLSQASGNADKQFDIFFNQAVDGLAEGSAVTFSGVPVGQVRSINLEPKTPQFVRVRIAVRDNTPVLVGTTATINGVGFTGVSQIQLDPPERDPKRPAGPQREITCAVTQCPYDAPIIPTKPGALGQLLSSAPELLDRITTLTARLTELLSDRNQASIASILENVQVISRNLAERSGEIAATMAEARIAIRQAGQAAEEFGQLADTSDQILQKDARPLIADLRQTIRAAETSMKSLDDVIGQAKPGVETFSTRTLPEVGQLIRDLRATSQSLRNISERIDQRGIGGVVGGERLPDYAPKKR
ncbi:MlaD family protein [Sphingosinicella sp. BN140058]|uniref:MlaD family protein n=1 Tax=Sphingosinicella sp. BN140058 TaxID=1892855 RepID=UPI001011D755|nr:MlaD family protein [Sphingosinicella sp. BN140058]QAY77405.1 MCE family protein [Sphingosinicella sp. BN140058]